MHSGISACLIVKNEEHNLRCCLQSIAGKVDEIVIVDTGSSDSTVAVAKEFTDTVYHFTWCDDFSAARNESLSYAKNTWIFVIDADEELHKDCDLRRLIAENSDATAFTFREVDATPDGTVATITETTERLFIKKSAYYTAVVHNKLWLENARIIHTDSILYHYGYNLTDEALRIKYEPRLSALKKRCSDDPSFESDYYFMATLMMLKQYEDALEVITSMLSRYDVMKNKEGFRVGINYCFLLYRRGNAQIGYENARKFFRETKRPIFLFFNGIFASSLHFVDESDAALAGIQPDDDFLTVPDFERLRAYARGMNSFYRNDMPTSQFFFDTYIKTFQAGDEQLLALGDIYVAIDRVDMIASLVGELEKSANPRAWALRAYYAEKTDDLAAAEKWYRKAVDVSPRSVWYNSLGVVYFRQNNIDDAIQAMEQAVQCFPIDLRAFDNLILICGDILHDKKKVTYWSEQRSLVVQKGL